MNRIREIVQTELGWNDSRWAQEEERYIELWYHSYALPVDLTQLSKDKSGSHKTAR
jgi:hypothetical protein